MQKPTLLILAAGMASRYGSLKQIQSFGPSGETIVDYSLYDAIRTGFGKVVFIIRREFAEEFKSIFDPKLKGRIEVDYVFQDLDAYMGDVKVPADRTKPWGTAHAILCAQAAIKEPFAVINADDFYGRDAFEKAYGFLANGVQEKKYAIIGYELVKTLSEYGTVSRGVCDVDSNNQLVSINERTKIYREGDRIVYEAGDEKHEVPFDSKVSMNFWCLHTSVFALAGSMFKDFLKNNLDNPKSEFFIPLLGDEFIHKNGGSIEVVPTASQWFGVTYKEDAPGVKTSIDKLVASGEYPNNLWA